MDIILPVLSILPASFASFLNKSWSEIVGSGWVVRKGVLGATTKVFESN